MKISQLNFTAIPDIGQGIGFCSFLLVLLKNSNLLVSNDLRTIDFTGIGLYLRWISRKITMINTLKLLFVVTGHPQTNGRHDRSKKFQQGARLDSHKLLFFCPIFGNYQVLY